MEKRKLGRGISVDGDAFRQLRVSAGWTQGELARIAGYSDRLIRKLESGGPVESRTARDVFDALTRDQPQTVEFSKLCIESCQPVEALIRQWFEGVFNQRNLELVDKMIHHDVELFAEGETTRGIEVIRARVEGLLEAFNPLELNVERVVRDGDSVVAFWHVRKRHVGEFLGVAATGRWVELKGSSFAHFRDGKISQARDHWDVQDLLNQISEAKT